MSVSIIIALVVIGVLLLLIEFLVIPGVTVAGISGTLLIIGGVFCGYYYHESPVGHIMLLSTLAVVLLLFLVALKTKTWHKMGLKSSINSHVEGVGGGNYKVGDTGVTISRLAPIGQIMINDKIIEARSMGGFIDPNVEIIITRTEKNKLFVEPK